MTAAPIYDEETMRPRARTGSAHTSVAAAIDAEKAAKTMTERIWPFFIEGPHTPEEVHAKLIANGEKALLTSVRARICGLHKAGRLVASGEKGLGESMRSRVIRWRKATPQEISAHQAKGVRPMTTMDLIGDGR